MSNDLSFLKRRQPLIGMGSYWNGSSGTEKENSKTIHEGRIHGNIGVTTSQQMLEAELKIAEWNIYEHITDLFLSEFIIPIYS